VNVETWGSLFGLSWRTVWCIVRRPPRENPVTGGLYLCKDHNIRELLDGLQQMFEPGPDGKPKALPTRLQSGPVKSFKERLSQAWTNAMASMTTSGYFVSAEYLKAGVPDDVRSRLSRSDGSASPGSNSNPVTMKGKFLNARVNSEAKKQLVLTLGLANGLMKTYQRMIYNLTAHEVPEKAFDTAQPLSVNDTTQVPGWSLNMKFESHAEACMWVSAFTELSDSSAW